MGSFSCARSVFRLCAAGRKNWFFWIEVTPSLRILHTFLYFIGKISQIVVNYSFPIMTLLFDNSVKVFI